MHFGYKFLLDFSKSENVEEKDLQTGMSNACSGENYFAFLNIAMPFPTHEKKKKYKNERNLIAE